jgi:hypothetical protein
VDKLSIISIEQVRAYFEGALSVGQSRTWQPDGAPFLYLEENDKEGNAEIHGCIEDAFLVQRGLPIFIVGGELDNPWVKEGTKAEDGELRAKTIRNGTKIGLKPGDVLRVPAGTPHQRLPNGLIFMQVFKVPRK